MKAIIMYDYLIVGAGLFGAVFAQQAKKKGKHCLVIEKRQNKGGNIFCKEINGIKVHQYGAHIFHTDKEHIWKYVNNYVKFNHYINSPLANYKGKYYNLPFNMNTFNQLWGTNTPEQARKKLEEQRSAYSHIKIPKNLEEQALILCGEDIYNYFIKGYTEKQWGKSAKELPASIIKRLPFRFTYNNNYFDDPYQGIPVEGYNILIDNLFKDIEIKCDTDYFKEREYFDHISKKIIFTGCIDEFFNFSHGKLEYRSLRFEEILLDIKDFQGNAVVNYNESSVPFTRIIEHKHFEFGTQPGTVITKEYPQTYEKGYEPYYPINDERNTRLFRVYQEMALIQFPKVIFGGRLGQYAYYDMDDTIESALQLADSEFHTTY